MRVLAPSLLAIALAVPAGPGRLFRLVMLESFWLGVVGLAVMLSGLYPAWKAGCVEPVETIRLV